MIGDKIKKLRRKNKVTQEQLAKHLNVTPQAVSKWEKSLAYPEIHLLVPIADYFSVTLDFLLRDWGCFMDKNSLFIGLGGAGKTTVNKIMPQPVDKPKGPKFVIIDCSDIKDIELDSENIYMEEKTNEWWI